MTKPIVYTKEEYEMAKIDGYASPTSGYRGGNTKPGPRAGRPRSYPSGTVTHKAVIVLSDRHYAVAIQLGGGSGNEGVRLALDRYPAPKEWVKTADEARDLYAAVRAAKRCERTQFLIDTRNNRRLSSKRSIAERVRAAQYAWEREQEAELLARAAWDDLDPGVAGAVEDAARAAEEAGDREEDPEEASDAEEELKRREAFRSIGGKP